jgi:hypothetical protein
MRRISAANRLKLQVTVGFIGFAIWSGLAYFDPALRQAYVGFIIMVVTGMYTLITREMKDITPPVSTSEPTAPPPEKEPQA